MKSRCNPLYLLAFLLAAALRFVQLGALPLTDAEAGWALQALSLSRGENLILTGQPGYLALTSFLFYLFESANFLARFVPAFAGTLIVLVPYFLRDKLGERAALVAAFFLAAAPGLVAVSRTASGTMLAVTFGALAWGFWQRERPQRAGLFAGVALLGGASVWMGLLGIALTWALAQNMLGKEDVEIREASQNHVRNLRGDLKIAAIYAGGIILLLSTRFLLSPNGLGAWFTSLANYLQGWRFASGVPAQRLLGALPVYYPLPLLFGGLGIWRAFRERKKDQLLLAVWALIALILALIYPARQVSDLIWAVLPLWFLSATELVRYFYLPLSDRRETLGVFALTFVLLVFSWLNLASAGILPDNMNITATHQALLAGSIVLLLLSLALIALGWSQEVAVLGGAWGTALALGIYTLGAAWGSTGLRTPKGVEMWDAAPRVLQAGLLLETVDEISTWSQGDAHSLNVVVEGIQSPALEWLLRHYDVETVASLDATTAPDLVLTPADEEVSLAATYRGQDFVWRQRPDWVLMKSIPKWVVLRELPLASEQIILWARNDLFFDSQNE